MVKIINYNLITNKMTNRTMGIKVETKLHKRLKIFCATNEIKLNEMVEDVLIEFLNNN